MVKNKHYWLTPPELYKQMDKEFHFDFDPCPFPRPEGFNGLEIDWKKSNWVNPPFRKDDCFGGKGVTSWVRKAIIENKKGKRVVLILPVFAHINILLEAGAEIRSAGRFPFLDTEIREASSHPHPSALFILR